jgi:hypothetical protein
MDLILVNKSPNNTIIADLNTGLALYHVDIESKSLTSASTKISKAEGETLAEMAHIEIHSLGSDSVEVWGKNSTPKRQGMLRYVTCHLSHFEVTESLIFFLILAVLKLSLHQTARNTDGAPPAETFQ